MSENASTVEVFNFLKEAIRQRGWSVPRFAKETGVSIGLAYKWLSEDAAYRITPSPKSCEKIAAALGDDPDYILELAGHRKARAGQDQADDSVVALRATTSEMADILRGLPRIYWGTVIQTFRRSVEGARDMAQLLTERPSPASTVRSSVDTELSQPGRVAKSRKLDGDQELANSKLAIRVRRSAMLVAL